MILYDIFISYKRISLPTANNLYYRLTTRGYSAFFDLEEMRKDNFDVQLYNYIEKSKDVFILLEEKSLQACIDGTWQKDWFCKEIEHALKMEKNIIPILLNDYKMPPPEFFPEELKGLSLKHSLEFSYSYFDEYLNKLIDKGYITSEPHGTNKAVSIFKLYSDQDCEVFKDGKLVGSVVGMSDVPYYLPVTRKGDYRFNCISSLTNQKQVCKVHIDADEEKELDIIWNKGEQAIDRKVHSTAEIAGEVLPVEVNGIHFEMLRVEGGSLEIGATQEQLSSADVNEYPAHKITVPTFYIAKFPVTQNLWESVMGYNMSHFRYKEQDIINNNTIIRTTDKGHYPAESITYDEAQEFVCRLSQLTGLQFDLPTEDEWEYAARGGLKTNNFIYAGSNDISEVAWYRGNSVKRTHPVGGKCPNELGLFDMCGNVWEWTKTPAHTYSSAIAHDSDIFIRRGGSWWHEKENCRVSRRYPSRHSKRTSGLGLRIVIRKNIV